MRAALLVANRLFRSSAARRPDWEIISTVVAGVHATRAPTQSIAFPSLPFPPPGTALVCVGCNEPVSHAVWVERCTSLLSRDTVFYSRCEECFALDREILDRGPSLSTNSHRAGSVHKRFARD